MIPFLHAKSPEFLPEYVFNILVSASRPPIGKRALRKGLLEFGILNIPKLEGLKDKFSTLEFEKFIYRYNLLLQKYVYKKEHYA